MAVIVCGTYGGESLLINNYGTVNTLGDVITLQPYGAFIPRPTITTDGYIVKYTQ